MRLELTNLPSDPELLQRLVRDIAAAIDHRDTEIERLKSIIKQLQRMQFGRSSERIDPDQLALGLEDLDSDIGRVEEAQPKVTPEAKSPPSVVRCPIICHAKTFCLTFRTESAAAVAVLFI
ncbi:Putative transposase (-fragment) [Bradyrhizobium sp. ORS 285]|nr:Putative transposase (-fragment) [Bradyrhizobium sp. ORS 285]